MASSLLILGGARSGKSRFAVAGLSPRARVLYIATAQPGDADMAARIARHQAERPPQWKTVEAPFDLVPRLGDALGAADTVVVDCLTLWVANLMLRGDGDEAILKEADALAALAAAPRAELRIVSNEAGLGVHPATADGLRFRDLLGGVNQRIAAAAARVVLMIAGLPHMLKDAPARSPTHERPPEAP
ncbi:MAG TPA: bifunctional adenosylcobinamide kinase/adenosylcobinamide-phosphate guanylyltransferase [Methylomirabilota bacterium]|nr:bifunctional adenosylcobinamide kinase/adenosylcobinamide-phosphate guanylyltransferase [Methylomirabilota bacterium]